jgi:hypothetical protein
MENKNILLNSLLFFQHIYALSFMSHEPSGERDMSFWACPIHLIWSCGRPGTGAALLSSAHHPLHFVSQALASSVFSYACSVLIPVLVGGGWVQFMNATSWILIGLDLCIACLISHFQRSIIVAASLHVISLSLNHGFPNLDAHAASTCL